MSSTDSPIRLQVYLARAGIASRRKSEEIILEGRVRVNGETVRKLGTVVSPGDRITLDGKPIYPEKRLIYLAVHKPRRYVCTASDPQGRPLALDLVRQAYGERLFTIGRLDYLSSGLIFFTNDGAFARVVSHPSCEVEKEYQIETAQPIPGEFLQSYQEGIEVNGVTYHLKHYSYKNVRAVRVVLTEGKNRELRTVFESRDLTIKRLHRVRIGPVSIRNIQAGHYRSLTRYEQTWFFQNAGLPPPQREVRDKW